MKVPILVERIERAPGIADRAENFAAIGIVIRQPVEIGTRAGRFIVPLHFVVEVVAHEAAILAQRRHLGLDCIFNSRRPTGAVDQVRPAAVRPGGQVQVLRHRNVKVMQRRIRPGAPIPLKPASRTRSTVALPQRSIAAAGRMNLLSKSRETKSGPLRIAPTGGGLNGGNRVQKVQVPLRADKPPDAFARLPNSPIPGRTANAGEARIAGRLERAVAESARDARCRRTERKPRPSRQQRSPNPAGGRRTMAGTGCLHSPHRRLRSKSLPMPHRHMGLRSFASIRILSEPMHRFLAPGTRSHDRLPVA